MMGYFSLVRQIVTCVCWVGGLCLGAAVVPLSAAESADEAKPVPVTIAGGAFSMQAPGSWVRQQPRTNIVEHEFLIPRAEGDDADGRLTIMGAGGSVQQNIDRWVAQFQAPAGGKVEKKEENKTIAGQKVHLVDLSGNYMDRRGPFAPATERASYRMLGAIIVTEGKGQHFIKLYGPQKTIAQAEKAFQQFVDSLSTRD